MKSKSQEEFREMSGELDMDYWFLDIEWSDSSIPLRERIDSKVAEEVEDYVNGECGWMGYKAEHPGDIAVILRSMGQALIETAEEIDEQGISYE